MHKYDFAVIRESVSPAMVLSHYSLDGPERRGEVRTKCPFAGHKGSPDSGDLAVNLSDWKFQCFSCKGKGRGALKFVELVEGIETKEAAERIYAWFSLANGNGTSSKSLTIEEPRAETPEDTSTKTLTNIPLKEKAKAAGKNWDGVLKLDHAHPYLVSRGFDMKLCQEYGVGYSGAGKMAGRIAFQIRNVEGEIVAYCGRAVDPKLEPRWKQADGFHKSIELYNLDRVLKQEFDTAIVVESFWGVLALARAGVRNGVATMGKDLSDVQAELLGHFRHVILMFDGNARAESAKAGCKLLSRNFESVKVIFLPDEKEWAQPDLIAPEDLYEMF